MPHQTSHPPSPDMPPTDPAWVLHLVPPNGGGVDRFVRDLCRHRPADRILHVTASQWVLEDARGHFTPLPAEATALAPALGHPAWVHAHSAEPAVRAAATALGPVLHAPLALTLHDITFASGDDAERAARRAFVSGARLLTAPSRYIAQVLASTGAMPEQAPCAVIPNGSDTPVQPITPGALHLPDGAPSPCILAVVGAMGQHKGLQHLLDTVQVLPPGIRVVLFGYLDGQLTPGWQVPEKLWVHGAFAPEQLGPLLSRYGVQRVWFPSGQPESFSYALSDVWQAGWPVTVPDHGALAERVRDARHSADHLYPPDLPAEAMALALATELAAAPGAVIAAPLSSGKTWDTAAMAHAYSALYRKIHVTDHTPPSPDLQTLAQQHLDSRFFRHELLRLQGDLQASLAAQKNLSRELSELSAQHQARGDWIRKLDADIAHLNLALREAQEAMASGHPWLHEARKWWQRRTQK